jgi:hypothetical protein
MFKPNTLRFKIICMTLVFCFVLPMLIMPADATAAPVVRFTQPGYTPGEVDAMAVDPQTWRLPHDTRFNPVEVWDGADGTVLLNESPDWDGYESFIPNPVVDWEKVREGLVPGPQFPAGMRPRLMRGAIFMVEFPDAPMVSSLPKGSEMMGNPQVDTGVYGLQGEERRTALRDFWRGFLNEYQPELNRGHNITGGWMDYSAGLWTLELSVFGPFMMQDLKFQHSNIFWNQTSTGNFGQYMFRNQFPSRGAYTGAALAAAVAEGVPFTDAAGAFLYDFMFFTVSGYCQSPTWQEMGSMMFESPYRRNHDGMLINQHAHFGSWGDGPNQMHVVPSVAYEEVIRDPVTREIIEGATGMDFTGWGWIQRIIDTITADGFDITVDWPGFRSSNLTTLWNAQVQATTIDGQNYNARRDAWVNANTCANRALTGTNAASRACAANCLTTNVPGVNPCLIRAFRAQWPASTRDNTWVRDNSVRPAFLILEAERLKYDTPVAPAAFAPFAAAFDLVEEVFVDDGIFVDYDLYEEIAFGQADETPCIAVIDGVTFVDGEPFDGEWNDAWNIDIVTPEGAEFIAEYASQPAFVPFAAAFATLDEPAAPVYSAAYQAFLATNSHHNIVYGATGTPENPATGSFMRLLLNAQAEAASNARNPYYQAAVSRYVPWTSWYGGVHVWSFMSSNMSIQTPVAAFSRDFSVQGEGTAMGVYSHELGHIVRLPDIDNMVYAEIPVRVNLGGWDMMARGAHVGYYGGHTRWNIPGIRAGSAGTGIMLNQRIGAGYTDLTVAAVPTDLRNSRNWVRGDYENSQDVKYVAYHDFRVGPPVFAEVFGRNTPTNRGFVDAHGDPITGYVGLVIEESPYDLAATTASGTATVGGVSSNVIRQTTTGATNAARARPVRPAGTVLQRFGDLTPGTGAPAPGVGIFGTSNALRSGNHLMGVHLCEPGTLAANCTRPPLGTRTAGGDWPCVLHGPQITAAAARATFLTQLIDDFGLHGRLQLNPTRWNWGYMNHPAGTQMTGTSQGETGVSAGMNRRNHGFTLEVIDRVGFDSFNSDHGVVISRSKHSHLVGGGGMDSKGIYIVDANPGNLGLVQFREADGTPYMMACDHHAQISTAAFHAGTHNNANYYRDIFPGRFLEDDPRPGVAGATINEWVDIYNDFHFYILAKNNHDGIYGTFISYDVAARSTRADAWKADGALTLVEAATPMIPAVLGNFSKQTYSLTNTGTETDIVRITLGGEIADKAGIEVSTKDQNAVIHNNLFAIGAGETITFDVFVKNFSGMVKDFDLTVTAASETNAEKAATAGLNILFDVTADPSSTNLQNSTTINVTVTEHYYNNETGAITRVVLPRESVRLRQNGTQIVPVAGYDFTFVVNNNNRIASVTVNPLLTNPAPQPPAPPVVEPLTARVVTALGSNVRQVTIEIRRGDSIVDTIILTNSGSEGSRVVSVRSSAGDTYSITRTKSQNGNNGITAITAIALNGDNIAIV